MSKLPGTRHRGGDRGREGDRQDTAKRSKMRDNTSKTGDLGAGVSRGVGDRDLKPDNATQCLLPDGTSRPMADVLRERRRLYLQRPAAERETAFRVRAGIAAALKVCTCSWPIERAETLTEHEPWCTAHAWLLGFMERDEGTPAVASVPYKQPTPAQSRPKRAARGGRESR